MIELMQRGTDKEELSSGKIRKCLPTKAKTNSRSVKVMKLTNSD